MVGPRESVPVATRLSPDLVAKLDAIAKTIGGTRSDALRKLTKEYEPAGDLDEEAPFFAEPLPAPRGAQRIKFQETRYDHVTAKGSKGKRK